jgi:hypothetical protein
MVKLLIAIVGAVVFGKIALFCLFAFCLHVLGYF